MSQCNSLLQGGGGTMDGLLVARALSVYSMRWSKVAQPTKPRTNHEWMCRGMRHVCSQPRAIKSHHRTTIVNSGSKLFKFAQSRVAPQLRNAPDGAQSQRRGLDLALLPFRSYLTNGSHLITSDPTFARSPQLLPNSTFNRERLETSWIS